MNAKTLSRITPVPRTFANPPRAAGFTVVELLVVVAIIALLVGILLPAIGKARDAALTSQSQSNLRQLGTAWQTYAGEYGDRQMTYINDYISQYGGNSPNPGPAIATTYFNANGQEHPPIVIGYLNNAPGVPPGVMVPFQITWSTGAINAANAAYHYCQPMTLFPTAKLGAFRFFGTRSFTTYLNGRNYDPVMYAPKDRAVMNAVEPYFDDPSESQWIVGPTGNIFLWSSYCLSPAAMWNPDVLSEQHGAGSFETAPLFNNPWQMAAGFKSPGMSQARYANLKTLFIEHNWLQNNKRTVCNPAFSIANSPYNCEPWYYNASILSNPMAVFYDGHVAGVGVRDAMDSNQRVLAQHGQQLATGNKGLWSKNTPLGGFYEPPAGTPPVNNSGYWQNAWAADGAATSFHILTSYGIKGRDIIPK